MMKKQKGNIKGLVLAAMIAALYTMATGLFAPIAFRDFQVRISEALCALALFTPWAVPGMTLGCLLSNILWSPFGLLDILVGTLATLLGTAGVAVFAKKNRLLALSMPVITNALLVPIVLQIFVQQAYLFGVLTVGVGQAIACMGLGYPLAKAMDKVKFFQ